MKLTQVGWAVAALLALAPAVSSAAGATDDPAFEYRAKSGDTLIGVSSRLLAEPQRWREVARASGLRNPDRIPIGQLLRVPVVLLRSVAEPAVVLSVRGEARSGDGLSLQAGLTLQEGQSVLTGSDGNVTLRLVDGTVLRLRSAGRLSLTESRRLPGASATRSSARLDAGRIEVEAGHARAGLPGFRVRTPQGVLAVRGTEFRVETDPSEPITRGEVLQGTVQVAAQPVAAGFGSVIGPDGSAASPIPLLKAPDVRALPGLQERVLVRFPLLAQEGAKGWRAQVATDATFDSVIADLATSSRELRFGELPDGDYVLRVRAIDVNGLQGFNADHAFRLKARPEPPLPSMPSARAVFFEPRIEFAWATSAEADRYELQLFAEGDPSTSLRDLPGLAATNVAVEGLAPGRYRWRLRSVRASGDAGPWGDPREFEVRPIPPSPPPPRADDNTLYFSWEGSPGQRFEFQVARDAAFTTGVISLELDQAEVALPKPGSGRFWLRLRARDPDGFVGPWTATQTLDLPNCLRDQAGACVKNSDGRVDVAP